MILALAVRRRRRRRARFENGSGARPLLKLSFHGGRTYDCRFRDRLAFSRNSSSRGSQSVVGTVRDDSNPPVSNVADTRAIRRGTQSNSRSDLN